MSEARCEGVHEGTAGRVVSLPRGLPQAGQRRKKEHEPGLAFPKRLRHPNTDIHLGGCRCCELSLSHVDETSVTEHRGGENQPIYALVPASHVVAKMLEVGNFASVCAEVFGGATQRSQFLDFRGDRGIRRTAPRPNNARVVATDQVLAEDFADAAGAANEQVDALAAKTGRPALPGRFLRLKVLLSGWSLVRLLAKPGAIPMSPGIAGAQRRHAQAFFDGPRLLQWQVQQANLPMLVLLGQ